MKFMEIFLVAAARWLAGFITTAEVDFIHILIRFFIHSSSLTVCALCILNACGVSVFIAWMLIQITIDNNDTVKIC